MRSAEYAIDTPRGTNGSILPLQLLLLLNPPHGAEMCAESVGDASYTHPAL